MSAPATDVPSSISSSGHTDGLGRRLLAFDRETGAIRERLYLRPELSAFEAPLRRRVQLLSTFDDERFARPCSVQRDPVTGELTVVSEFIAGSRLSDLIETAHEVSWVPGVDAALGFLLEALPALSSFHSVLSVSHGLIDPTRIAITPAGQVVFLDTSFGEVVERLVLSPARLWVEFGLAARQSSGRVRLDAASDVRQVALSAIILVLGRRLRLDEFQGSLSSVLAEVGEVAQIRGSAAFAAGLQQIVQRCLALPGESSYHAADEPLADVRALVTTEIGEDVCHRALIEFLEQMDAACDAEHISTPRPVAGSDASALAPPITAAVADDVRPELAPLPIEAAVGSGTGSSSTGVNEEEISLDALTFGEAMAAGRTAAAPQEVRPNLPSTPSSLPAPVSPAANGDESGQPEMQVTTVESSADEGQAVPSNASTGGSARRRKRHQRSARERKDKLRSASAEGEQGPKPPTRSSPWIVSPAKAAIFQPVEQTTQPVIPLPVFPPLSVTRLPAIDPESPPPDGPAVATTPIAAPVAGQPVPIAPGAPSSRRKESTHPSGGLRIKPEPPPGFKPPRVKETLSTQPYIPQGPLFGVREPARFPARLAAALIAVVAVGIVVGRSYLPARGAAPDPQVAAAEVEPPVVVAPQPEYGEIVVRSQPAGVRVLLDGKPVGETPLKLTSVATGRHVLTFASAAGEVTRSVRVASGQTVDVEVPVFSGWLAVFAPIVLDVLVNGRTLGTTEETRLMLPPGRHKVTLANRELGYRAVQTIEIEPGEVQSVTIEPRGRVSLNAIPWAEVWLEGRRLGDTPIADLELPLGVREFVFIHPEHGERKTTAVVRGDQPIAVSVDFTRSKFD